MLLRLRREHLYLSLPDSVQVQDGLLLMTTEDAREATVSVEPRAKETKGPLWRTNQELRPGKSLCPARFCWGPEVEARKELLQPRKGAEGTSLV